MCNYKNSLINDVSIKDIKYILFYNKCLSVHSAVHFNCISKTIEVIMKLHIKIYLSPT